MDLAARELITFSISAALNHPKQTKQRGYKRGESIVYWYYGLKDEMDRIVEWAIAYFSVAWDNISGGMPANLATFNP